jgi:hypothetical protein
VAELGCEATAIGVRHWCTRRPIGDEVEAPKQTATLHIADHVVPRGKFGELGRQSVAHGVGVVQKLFVVDHVEHRVRYSRRYRVAAEGIEVRPSLSERGGNLWSGDHSRHGVPRTHRLADRDDVRHQAV